MFVLLPPSAVCRKWSSLPIDIAKSLLLKNAPIWATKNKYIQEAGIMTMMVLRMMMR
jgi:hypothetical protein